MSATDAKSIGGKTPLVLVVDDQQIIREPVAACLKMEGYDVVAAGSAAEALALLKTCRPDLIILDVHMPGMDGLALLATLRVRAETAGIAVILLTVEADRRFVVQASKLGVREYVLKAKFSLKELLERVARSLARPGALERPAEGGGSIHSVQSMQHQSPGASAAALCTREQLMERARNAVEGKTLSGMVAQVISLAASPRTSTTELAGAIVRDPMLSANVLRVANSAAYTSAQAEVTNIADAIRKIGSAVVGRIAAAIAVMDAMPETVADGFNPIRAWQHSFAVAQLCQQLAPQGKTGGLPYLVGLCHDLSEILFHAHFAEEAQKVLEVQHSSGRPRAQIERELLGMTRSELAPVMLGRLGLPETIRTSIEVFHAALATGTPPLEKMARVLWLAELYANGALLASSSAGVVMPVTQAFCKKAHGDANPPRPDVSTLRAEVYCLTTLMARLAPREEMSLASPLMPTRSVKIWLARDEAFSTFDPLAAALGALSQLQIHSRQPTAAEAQEVDGVVVTTCNTSGSAGAGAEEIGAMAGGRSGLSPLWLTTAGHRNGNAVGLPITLAELERFVETVGARSESLAA